MYKIGIDLIEIERVKKSIESKHFCERVFGENELKELLAKNMPAQSAAACFAAKEAFGKAMGTGVSGFALTEVEVLHKENGKPYLKLSGNALKLAKGYSFDISITHTRELASAVVIAYKEG